MTFAESVKSLKSESIKQIILSKEITNCHFGLKNSSNENSLIRKISAELLDLYKNSSYEGLTGNLSFDEYGFRKNFEIGLYKIDFKTPLKKVSYLEI